MYGGWRPVFGLGGSVERRRTRKMVNLAIEETSGVDHPAHLEEGWLVMKAADPVEVEKAMAPMKTEDGVEFPAEAFAYVPDPEKEAHPDASDDEIPSVLKATNAQEGHMEEKSTEERLDEALKALAAAESRIADMEKEMSSKGEPKDEETEDDEDMMKAAPESVRKAFEAMEKQAQEAMAKADAAEETLRKERAERADAEAVTKAREAFASLGLDAEQVGPALRRLAEIDEPLAKSIETTLTAANAKVESADIFSEIGSTPVQTGSAFHKAEAMAKAAVSDGVAATFEQALADVFVSDPALYNEYLAEKKG